MDFVYCFLKVFLWHKEAESWQWRAAVAYLRRGGVGQCVPALCIQLVRRSAAVARHTHYGFSRKQDAFGAIRYFLRTGMRMDR